MINMLNVHLDFQNIPALKGVSLKIKKGTLFGIVGPGGCGKSSLCKVVMGIIKPKSGVVFVAGKDMMKASPRTIAQIQSKLGVQFQNDALFEHMTALDNVAYPLKRQRKHSASNIVLKSMEYLAMVGLAGFDSQFPNELSGGQRKRVAIARACVTNPELLICDDPTAGLDPVTSRQILDMIAGIRYQFNSTVLIVSSDTLGILSIADEIALMWDGTVIASGTSNYFWESKRKEVKRFLSDARPPFEKYGLKTSWSTKWD